MLQLKQNTHTHTPKQFHLHSRLLFLPHTFAEDDESFPGARRSVKYQRSSRSRADSFISFVEHVTLIEYDAMKAPIPVHQTQVIPLGATWHSLA